MTDRAARRGLKQVVGEGEHPGNAKRLPGRVLGVLEKNQQQDQERVLHRCRIGGTEELDGVELDPGTVEPAEPGPSLEGTGRLGPTGNKPVESAEFRGGELVAGSEPCERVDGHASGEVKAVEAYNFVRAEANAGDFLLAVAGTVLE